MKTRKGHLIFLIHPVHRKRPGKMSDSRPPVAVLSVTGIEPHVHRKGLILRLILQELNAPVDDQLSLMA